MIRIYMEEIIEEISQYLKCSRYKSKIKVQIKKDREILKWKEYTHVMFQWMKMKQKGHFLTEYLKKYECKRIAVYGLGEIGSLCCDEILRAGEVEIMYIIDREVQGEYRGIPIIQPDKVDGKPEAILITPVYCYLQIAEVLCRYTNVKLISLEDIVTVLSGYEGQKYYG